MPEFLNNSEHEFSDISSEQSRTYVFPDQSIVVINRPLKLSVSKSGGHRIFDAYGLSHYIPSGWNHLYWEAKEGRPNFVK